MSFSFFPPLWSLLIWSSGFPAEIPCRTAEWEPWVRSASQPAPNQGWSTADEYLTSSRGSLPSCSLDRWSSSCTFPMTKSLLPPSSVQFSSVSRVWLFATPWTAACQASLSITNSQSLFKLISIESVMPSNPLILSSPSPPAFNLSQHHGLFKWVSSSCQMAQILEFQLQHQSFQWIFRTHFL